MSGLKSIMLSTLAGIALCGTGSSVAAEEFPSRVVRVLSPYAPGLAPDVALRIVAGKLERSWQGKPVVIESRPGANGTLAIGAAKKGDASGHTLLLLGHSHLTINPVLHSNLNYDAQQDFIPLGMLYRAPFYICVATNSPYKTVGDLLAAAREKPGKLTYATSYIGSPSHFATAKLEFMTGTDMLPVHYATEGTQAYTSIVNGDVVFTLASAASVEPLVKSGRLRMLATTSPTRVPSHPEVPTIRESGGPADYEFETWSALVAPRGTSESVVRKIRADISKALADPEARARLQSLGFEPARERTQEEFSSLIRDDLKRNQDLIKRTGISLQ
ncbi:TctC [Cupriavidus sp. SK-4]|uniref:Bug family tripartite tricarboxylate transporter substrate binding protein n=1 Tax=Cupriavidus sp. SK-4 TaxID=574750 RepID=UPI000446EBCB|nr:tripartite tricarboxylate transporter substrate binding protein [Cupriavidus sp. SK-4]EYS81194.1 TctC [Cupriavidus sp. SK-4]